MPMRIALLVLSAIAAVVGVTLLLSSPGLGLDAANGWLRSVGGNADTGRFMAIMQGYMDAYRLLGAVLLAGGIGGLLQGYRERSR